MEWFKNSLHWCHRMFWYSFAVIAILLAIAISLIRIFITDVRDYRQEIEHFASTILEQDVKIDSMEAEMAGFSPLIILNDVRLLAEDGESELIRFNKAKLTIDPVRSLLNFKIIPQTLTVDGVSIGVTRKADGTLSIRGLNLDQLGEQFTANGEQSAQQTNELADWLFKRSELAIQHSTVIWQDELNENKTIQIEDVNFFLRNDDDRHQLNGSVRLPPEFGHSLEIAFDFDGNLLDPREWYGQFYAQGKGLSVENWAIKPVVISTELQSGKVDLRIWGESEAGRIRNLTADFSLQSFEALLGESKERLAIKQLSGLFKWQGRQDGWQLTADHLQFEGETGPWPKSRLRLDYQITQGNVEMIDGYASYLRLQDLKEVLGRSPFISEDIKQTLNALAPQGELHELVLKSSLSTTTPRYRVSAGMKNVSIAPYQKFPGISNFSAELSASETRGHARLLGKDSQLFLPKLFREPLALAQLQARVDWWHDNHHWFIQAKDVQLANADIAGLLSVKSVIPDEHASPFLDLQVSFQNGNAVSAYKYFPVAIMDKDLVAWLDNAFRSGKVTQGGFVFTGRLADFPFKNHDGIMLADFYTEDVLLDYRKEWPAVRIHDGHVMISGLGLTATVSEGEIYTSKLREALIAIDDFNLPRLDISGTFTGEAHDLINYLVNSPIAKGAGDIYSQSKISGQVTGKLELKLPLSGKAEKKYPVDYLVDVNISNSRIDLWDNKLVVDEISGNISYRPGKLRSRDLKAKLLDQAVGLRFSSRSNEQADEIQLTMKGKLDAGKLRAHLPSKIFEHLTGVTDWNGVLSFGKHYADGRSTPGYLHITSQLDGINSNLPSPLTKSARDSKPLKVQLRLPDKNILPVHLRYGTDITAAFAINLNQDAALFKKGSVIFLAETAQMPKEDQFLIKGWLTEMPLSEWTKLSGAEPATASRRLIDPATPLRIDLDYLNVKTTQTDTASTAIDPRTIPVFGGEIRKLVYNNIEFGKFNLQAVRQTDGLTFKEIKVAGSHLTLSGEGSWVVRDGKQLTNLLLKVGSDNLGVLLTELGYSAVIRNGELQSVIQANWSDSPNNFSLAGLSANIGAVISDGVISEVKPGAGRLLGLLSLSELPRRLQLDFSEFRNGLAFSQIVGQVEISNGLSNIDTLRIISPVALMQIEGSTNLVDKSFDQSLRVVPNISGTAPIVSWLALGGQVGAVVFLLDQMFGDTFDEAAGTDYHITGTWENPLITKQEITPPRTGAGQVGD